MGRCSKGIKEYLEYDELTILFGNGENNMKTNYWEVDLRSRKDGNTIETIFSGEWHDEACDCLNRWYKEHPEVDGEVNRESLVDGTDEVFADIYCTTSPHGVGKWK